MTESLGRADSTVVTKDDKQINRTAENVDTYMEKEVTMSLSEVRQLPTYRKTTKVPILPQKLQTREDSTSLQFLT